jgi:hypothetical protein
MTHDVRSFSLAQCARIALNTRAALSRNEEPPPDNSPRWATRWDARTAVAKTFGVPPDAVTVMVLGYYPESRTPRDYLAMITDPRSGQVWRFRSAPDRPAGRPAHVWQLLEQCYDCAAPDIPVADITSLADLGAYLAVGPYPDRHPFEGDPGHRPGCLHGPLDD